MFSFNPQVKSHRVVLEKHLSVKAAADRSGYSIQYLRRLLREGILHGIKIGQVWLIKMASLDAYLEHANSMGDRRCGTKVFSEALSTSVNVSRQQM